MWKYESTLDNAIALVGLVAPHLKLVNNKKKNEINSITSKPENLQSNSWEGSCLGAGKSALWRCECTCLDCSAVDPSLAFSLSFFCVSFVFSVGSKPWWPLSPDPPCAALSRSPHNSPATRHASCWSPLAAVECLRTEQWVSTAALRSGPALWSLGGRNQNHRTRALYRASQP